MKTIEEYLKPKLPIKNQNIIKWVLLTLLILLLLPWKAFTTGVGKVTSIDPNERVQVLTAPVTGFIKSWRVKEGQKVKVGDVVAELSDNDPSLLERMERERQAAFMAYESSKLMAQTSQINLDRQKQLFNQGLSARKEYEKAKIEFSKNQMEEAKALAKLTKAETQFSRQSTQIVKAPRNGTITRVLPGESGQLIKAGSPIAVFAPDVSQVAIEVWIDGNDMGMLQAGQRARVQFEGWPSVQIPGWPSVSIATFKAKVQLIDQGSSQRGKFRVLLTPEEAWPSEQFLRLGANARAYVQLADSFVLKEIWRQLNSFPPHKARLVDEFNSLLKQKNDSENEEKESGEKK